VQRGVFCDIAGELIRRGVESIEELERLEKQEEQERLSAQAETVDKGKSVEVSGEEPSWSLSDSCPDISSMSTQELLDIFMNGENGVA